MKYIQIIISASLLLTGVVLSFISFFMAPQGEIADSVLWYFGQTLVYAGSTFGFKLYVDQHIRKL